MSCTKYSGRKSFGRRNITEILLLSILFFVFLYVFARLQQFLLSPKQSRTTVAFEITKDNKREIGLSEDKWTEERTLLLIAVLTHWRRWKRRDSIRATWMTQCDHTKVTCLFFTDDVGAEENDKLRLKTEISSNNDTILMPMTGTYHGFMIKHQMDR